jgi:hypothetical protein
MFTFRTSTDEMPVPLTRVYYLCAWYLTIDCDCLLSLPNINFTSGIQKK